MMRTVCVKVVFLWLWGATVWGQQGSPAVVAGLQSDPSAQWILPLLGDMEDGSLFHGIAVGDAREDLYRSPELTEWRTVDDFEMATLPEVKEGLTGIMGIRYAEDGTVNMLSLALNDYAVEPVEEVRDFVVGVMRNLYGEADVEDAEEMVWLLEGDDLRVRLSLRWKLGGYISLMYCEYQVE